MEEITTEEFQALLDNADSIKEGGHSKSSTRHVSK
jgi:hypothetical protein